MTDTYNFVQWAANLRHISSVQRAQVVLSFMDDMNIFVSLAMCGVGVPVIVAERTFPQCSLLSKMKRRVRPFVYRYLADNVVGQTSSICNYMRDSWNLENVVVIPNAVHSDFKRTLNLDLSNKVVSTVGRLHSQKGQDVLLEAWALLGDLKSDWTLRIVGSGDELDSLKLRAAKLAIERSVRFVGQKKDVNTELEQASLFVLPSRVEGFPNALLEAMAMGCACIATDGVGACAELIESGVNGELVPVDDVEALAASMSRLMASQSLRQSYAARAVDVKEKFSSERVYRLWESLLIKVVGAK